MGKKIIFLLTLAAVTVFSALYVVGGTQAYSRYQQSSLANKEYCGGQPPVRICVRSPQAIFSAFYPSYVATQTPLFTVMYSSNSPATLLISVSINKMSQVQTRTVNTTAGMQNASFVPSLLKQALPTLTQEENTSLHVQVKGSQGQTYYVNDIPLLLHSRWLMQWIPANRLQIAAWVTPDEPMIADLVTRASPHLGDQQPPVPLGMIGTGTLLRNRSLTRLTRFMTRCVWTTIYTMFRQASLIAAVAAVVALRCKTSSCQPRCCNNVVACVWS